jgi:hypothetical protein
MKTRKVKGYWQIKENVEKESRKYSSRQKWCRDGGSSYHGAKRNGWLDELMPSQTRSLGSWTKEELQVEARKFNKRTAFSDGALSAYRAACKLGVMDKICMHMSGTLKGHWRNLENLKADSAKYNNKTKWIEANPAAYEAAKDMEVVDECCEHMTVYRLPQNTWTKERILLKARKFNKRNDWKGSPGGAYSAACDMGVLVEACAHMKRLRIASDSVYLLKAVETMFNGKPVVKPGVPSEANFNKRIGQICWDSGLKCEFVKCVYTGEENAKNVERTLLDMGEDPNILSSAKSGKRLTEFRAYDDEEYACAIDILTDAKIDK